MREFLGAMLTSTGYVPFNVGGFDELVDTCATHRKVVGVRCIYCVIVLSHNVFFFEPY